ncbi:MAG: hypothetical protein ACOX4V_06350 [Anaerovoracaceae bacterium]
MEITKNPSYTENLFDDKEQIELAEIFEVYNMEIRRRTKKIQNNTLQAIIEFSFENYVIFVFHGVLSQLDILVKYKKPLNGYGEYDIEFLYVLMQLLAVQEKTNRADAYMWRYYCLVA